jgi:hypothetical protein
VFNYLLRDCIVSNPFWLDGDLIACSTDGKVDRAMIFRVGPSFLSRPDDRVREELLLQNPFINDYHLINID